MAAAALSAAGPIVAKVDQELEKIADDPLLFAIKIFRWAGVILLGSGTVMAIASYELRRSASQARSDAANRFKQIQSSFAKVSGAFGNLQPLKPIKLAAMPNLPKDLQGPLETIANGAAQIAHGADPSQVKTAMQGAWSSVQDWYDQAQKQGFAGISSDTVSAIKGAGSTLESWFGGAEHAAGDIVNGAKNVLQGVLGSLGATLSDIGKAIGAIGEDLLQGLEDVGVALKDVGQALADIPPALVALGQGLLTAITSTPFILWDGLVGSLGGVIGELLDWIYPYFLLFGGICLGVSIALTMIRTSWRVGAKPAYAEQLGIWGERQRERIWTPLFRKIMHNPPPQTVQIRAGPPAPAPQAPPPAAPADGPAAASPAPETGPLEVGGEASTPDSLPGDRPPEPPEGVQEVQDAQEDAPNGPEPPAPAPEPSEGAPAQTPGVTKEQLEQLLGDAMTTSYDRAKAALREGLRDRADRLERPAADDQDELATERTIELLKAVQEA